MKTFRDKKIIIIGEVNTGKTTLMCRILEGFRNENVDDIAVIDMAPESTSGIGGKMAARALSSTMYYNVDIVPPRLAGKNMKEVNKFALDNARRIDAILAKCDKNPCKTLFINDVSLYLQAGDPNRLFGVIDSTPTVFVNGRDLGYPRTFAEVQQVIEEELARAAE